MAINFPDNPVDGEIYINPSNGSTWQWLDANDSWNQRALSTAAVTDTLPTTPNVGDLWFNTETAQLLVWYDDGDSTQWVSAVAGVLPSGGNATIGGAPLANQIAFWNNGTSIDGDPDLTWVGGRIVIGTPTGVDRGEVAAVGGYYDWASSGNGGYGGMQAALSTGGASLRAYGGDPANDTFIDFDARDTTTGDLDIRVGRNTNTTGEQNFLIYAGDGTSSVNYSFSKTSARIGPRLALGGQFSPQVALDIQDDDAIQLPVGSTAQRPTDVSGRIRYNSDSDEFEGYTTAWNVIAAEGTAKCWASGTSSAHSDTYNMSSFVDQGVGQYENNFTNVFADAEQAYAGAARSTSGDRLVSTGNNAATSVRCYCFDGTTLTDMFWGIMGQGRLA